MANQRLKVANSSKPNPEDKGYLKVSGLALEMAVFNLICIWMGYELSERFSPKSHWILLCFAGLSAIGTFYFLFKKISR